MRTALILTSLFTLFMLVSCNSKNTDYKIEKAATKGITEEPHPGENLFMAYCFSCHNNNATEESRIAPPVFAIQRRYKMEFSNKEKFVEAIVEFTNNPNEENALMIEAIQKFGVMPQMSYNKKDLQTITDYIYEGDFTHPAGTNQEGMNNVIKDPLHRAKFASKATKANLGKNLIAAIKNKGTEGAISFCNVHAISITDSMTNEMGVISIQRVSDRARNPKNRASQEEIDYINSFKESIEKGEEIEPIVNVSGNEYVFYSPIATNKLCIQCHGEKEQIKPEVLSRINTLYPEDQATGYSENQVRGMWKIVMKKN